VYSRRVEDNRIQAQCRNLMMTNDTDQPKQIMAEFEFGKLDEWDLKIVESSPNQTVCLSSVLTYELFTFYYLLLYTGFHIVTCSTTYTFNYISERLRFNYIIIILVLSLINLKLSNHIILEQLPIIFCN